MDVTGVTGQFLRVTASPGGAQAPPPIPLGQTLVARVVEGLGDGRWLLDIGTVSLEARSGLPLVPGDRLEVVAQQSGSTVDLRLLGMAARFDERAYAVATLTQAGAQAVPSAPLPSSPRLLLALLEAVAGGARPDTTSQVVRLASMLAPLDPQQPPEALAASLQRLLIESGVSLEGRLRAALGSAPSPAADASRGRPPGSLPASVEQDLRVLLAAAARELAAARIGPGTDGAEAGAAIERSLGLLSAPAAPGTGRGGDLAHTIERAVRALLPSTPAEADAGPATPGRDAAAEHQVLVERTLARQLDIAYQWLRDRVVHLELPILLGDRSVVADLRVATDADEAPRSHRTGPRAFTLDVRVDLPDTGRMLARVQWAGASLATRVVVENDRVRRLVEADLPELVAGLRRAGIVSAHTEVVVGPSELLEREPPSAPAPSPGGAIFSARA